MIGRVGCLRCAINRGVVLGRKLDSAEDMGLWLDVDKLDEEGDASVPPDIFVIGFQEVKYVP